MTRLRKITAVCGLLALMAGCGGGGPATEVVEEHHPNGNKKKVFYYKGTKSNIVRKMNFTEDGSLLYDQHFKNNEPDSSRTIFYPGSKQMSRQEFFSNGQKHGADKEWYESGQLKSTAEYADGAPVGKYTMYFEDGRTAREAVFKDGQKHGEEVEYFPAGQKKRVRNFNNGRQEGIDQEFFESGKVKTQHEYADNAMHGKYVKYAEKKSGGDTFIIETGSYNTGQFHDTIITYNTKTGRKEALAVYNKGSRVFGESFVR